MAIQGEIVVVVPPLLPFSPTEVCLLLEVGILKPLVSGRKHFCLHLYYRNIGIKYFSQIKVTPKGEYF